MEADRCGPHPVWSDVHRNFRLSRSDRLGSDPSRRPWPDGPGECRPTSSRAWEAGLLIGLGAAVKTVPLLMVLALLPYARSWREGAKLVATAMVTVGLALGPLWLAGIDLHRVTGYAGVPAWGSLSLVLDPGLAWHNVTVRPFVGSLSGLGGDLQSVARWITLGALVVYAGFILRYRPALIDAAVLLWLAIFTFSPDFFLTYLVWVLPFFIMAGYLLEVAILQAFLVIPTVAYYLVCGRRVIRPWESRMCRPCLPYGSSSPARRSSWWLGSRSAMPPMVLRPSGRW